MKLKPWDIAFSRAIRESYHWTCAICELVDTEAQFTGKSRIMQCAHVFSRKHKNVRCHPDNAVCLCARCHAIMTDAPTEWGLWVIRHLGQGRYDMLLERKNDITIKYYKNDMDEITDHYKREFERITKERMINGLEGYIELMAYY